MRLIITRPQERALPLQEKLRTLGHDVALAPMLRIVPVRFDLPEGPYQGILFTSVQGVEAAKGVSPIKIFPAFTVGGKTAAAAKRGGFETVHNADGNVDALMDLVIEKCTPGKGPLLHLAGDQTAGNLVERLVEKGFEARRRTVYEALAADTFPPSIVEKFREAGFDGVLFFSARTASIFRRLVEEADFSECLKRAEAFCLSDNIGAEAGKLPWKRIQVAEAPTEQAMINLLESARK